MIRPVRCLRVLAVAVLAVGAIAACDSGSSPQTASSSAGPTVPPPSTLTTTKPPVVEGAVAGSATPTAKPSVKASPSGSAASVGPEHFVTPSKNIGCFIDGDGVRCDIVEREWKLPAKPSDCELDWGDSIGLDAAGAAVLSCHGDTVLGASAVLAYGDRARRGPFECESNANGVACANLTSGHSFFMSRREYRLS